MAVSNFIPSVWAASFMQPLDKALVFGGPSVINRDYEGEISGAGDTVRINAIGPITVNDYVKNGTVGSPESLTDAQTVLTVDQQKYFNFFVDDIDRRQANVEFMSESMMEAAYQMSDVMDLHIASKMGSACGTELFAAATPGGGLGTEGVMYDYIVDLQVALDEANVPKMGRFVVLPPYCIGKLRKDGNIVASGAEQADVRQVNGLVTRIAGIDILESNNVPKTSSGTEFHCIGGYRGATTFASQITTVEGYRSHTQFADVVRGLEVYGVHVARPAGLVGLWVTRI